MGFRLRWLAFSLLLTGCDELWTVHILPPGTSTTTTDTAGDTAPATTSLPLPPECHPSRAQGLNHTEHIEILPVSNTDDLGWGMAAADWTGDGWVDLVLSGDSGDSKASRVWLFPGPIDTNRTTNAAALLWEQKKVAHADPAYLFGGDYNGDGNVDLGLFQEDVELARSSLFLHRGAPGGPAIDPSLRFDVSGTSPGRTVDLDVIAPSGTSLVLLGDATHDEPDDSGRIFLIDPSAHPTGTGIDAETAARAQLDFSQLGDLGETAAVADVDGDGTDEILTTHTYLQLHAWLVPTPDAGIVDADSAWTWRATSSEGFFHRTEAGLGDFDGDGLADAVFGSGQADFGQGRVSLWFGELSGDVAWEAPDLTVSEGWNLGGSLRVEDLDCDGIDDVLAGEIRGDFGVSPWRISVFYGPLGPGARTSDDSDATFSSLDGNSAHPFGFALATGDFDGSGSVDLVSSVWPDEGHVQFWMNPL